MKLWMFSDLHLRPGEPFPPDVPDADVAVVAGDVTDGLVEAVTRLGRAVRPRMPVVAVAGNHEYHGGVREAEIARGLAAAADHGVHLLDDTAIEIDGVTFLGGSSGPTICSTDRRTARPPCSPRYAACPTTGRSSRDARRRGASCPPTRSTCTRRRCASSKARRAEPVEDRPWW